MHDPQLLFPDESTTGLDPQSRARVWDEVRRMHDRGTTVFLTTHYPDEADTLCDRIAIIDYGKIAAEGTPDELKRAVAGDVVTLTVAGDQQRALDALKDQPFVREARLDKDYVLLYVDRGEVAMPNVLRLLDGAGLQLETIGLHRPSLDDVRPDELLINEGALKPDCSDCRSGLLYHWNLVCSAALDQSLDELAITEPHKDGFRPQRWDSETNPRSNQVESSHHVH